MRKKKILLRYYLLYLSASQKHDKVSLEVIEDEALKVAKSIRRNFDEMKGNAEEAQAQMSNKLEKRIRKEYNKEITVGKAKTELISGMKKHAFNFIPVKHLRKEYSEPIIVDCTADIFCDENMNNCEDILMSFGTKEYMRDCEVLVSWSREYRVNYNNKSTWTIQSE